MYNENEQEILERMLNKLPNDLFKGEGSFFYDGLSTVSIELAENKRNLEDILEKAFPQTSYGEFLEKLAALHGVFRKKGKKAKCTKFIFEGIDGTLIPKGTLVQTVNGLQYSTLDDATVYEGTVVTNIEAVEEGELYRVPENTITVLPVQILGVSKVYNATAVEGGSEKEDDESLRNRLLQKAQSPSACGNKQDYINWAKEIQGVKNAKVIPLWNGPGTVKIICSGSNNFEVNKTILNKVKQYIDPTDGKGNGKAPIGANVTVVSSIPLVINIKIFNLKANNLEIAKENIKNNIKQFLETITPGQTIKLKNIEAIITQTQEVQDFLEIKLNNSDNIILNDDEFAILGDVTLPTYNKNATLEITFETLEQINMMHGVYDKVNKRLVI